MTAQQNSDEPQALLQPIMRGLLAAFDELLDASAAEREARLLALRASDPTAAATLLGWLAADADAAGIAADPAHFAALLIAEADESATGEQVDSVIGAYRLVRELGRGGMGAVWLAERADGQFQQQVALKLIKRGMDSDAVLARFRAERQILARLDHANIAHLMDGGIAASGQPYFVLEYVDGAPLLDYARREQLDLRACLRLFGKLCSAVAYAHSRLIVHRDLKPANVLVTAQGEPKLLDFGIAKLLGDEAAEATGTGERVFTPAYAAPEQLAGEPVGTATDVYALGLVLFELLTGQSILRDGLFRAHTTERPSTVRARSSDVGPATIAPGQLRGDVDSIVLKALAREPARRYASAQALGDDIERYLDGRPIVARPDNWAYRSTKFLRRHRLGVAAAGLVLLALSGGLAAALWQAQRANAAALRAETVKSFLMDLFRASDPNEARGRSLSARDLLDQGAARLDADASIDGSMRAELLGLIGEVYLQLGEHAPAETQLVAAEQVALANHGAESREHARALSTLGRLRGAQGRYHKAIELLRSAASVQRRLGASADSDRVVSLSQQSLFSNSISRIDQGLSLAREAVALAERATGRESLVYIDALGALTNAHHWRNEYAEAVPVYRQMLVSLVALLGARHPRTIRAQNSLGAVLCDIGQYAEGEAVLRQSLAAARQVFGPNNLTTLAASSELGFALLNQADVREAENLLRSGVIATRQSLGSEHPRVAYASIYLMYALLAQGRLREAAAAGQEAAAIYAKALGVHGSYAMRAKAGLADVYREGGQPERAVGLLREILLPSQAQEGDDGIHVALVKAQLALTELDLGQIEAAEALAPAAREVLTRRLGADHDYTWTAERALARTDLARQRAPQAERRLRDLLARFESHYGADDFRTAMLRWEYAQTLTNPALRAAQELPALRALAQDAAADHPLAVMARLRLAGEKP